MEPSDQTPDSPVAIRAADSISQYSYNRETIIKVDPENKVATEILNKDLKRWKRKLDELAKLKVPWSTICFGIGTSGISIAFSYINKTTKFVSVPAVTAIVCLVLIVIAIMLWKAYECNIPGIARDILMDLPKDISGNQHES